VITVEEGISLTTGCLIDVTENYRDRSSTVLETTCINLHWACNEPGEGEEGTSDFKWHGRSKDCFGFEICYSGIFLGIRKNLKICGSVRVSRLRTCSSANKVQPHLILPRWSCLELSLIMLLLKQKMFLGVPSVVRMTARWGKDKINWYDEYKQTQTFNF